MWDLPIPLFPERASTLAGRVDDVFFVLMAITVFFTVVIGFLVIFFAIRYRKGSQADRSHAFSSNLKLELAWIGIPLVIVLGIFAIGTQVFFEMFNPPKNVTPIYVVGKQWMWKIQHPQGRSEINEIHLPMGRPVQLIMTSQDVIHSFYIPAFRMKQDVLPGRLTSEWFEPNKPGRYHLFCAEYCGTQHSRMGGWVVVMEPAEYEKWLKGSPNGSGGGSSDADPVDGLDRRPALREIPLHRLPRSQFRVPGSEARRRLRRPGPDHGQQRQGRRVRDRRRRLHPRFHPSAQVEGRGRLRSGDAVLQGRAQGRRVAPDHGIHQVDRAEGGSSMSVLQHDPQIQGEVSTYPGKNYLNTEHTVKSWLLTTDHKRIGILYMISITFFFFIGGAAATLMRLELATPRGDLLRADIYNRMFTLHGIVMVFFFMIPSIPAVLGNFFLPMMIGARDLAFPRINLLSWYIYIVAGLLALTAVLWGGIDTGWTFYTPYSSMYSNSNVLMAAGAAFVAGFSSILTGLNFIVTVHKMRAPGMTWFRMPLFVWAQYATSIIMILGTPVLAITLVLLMLERVMRVGIFDPALGGDPILFQHLFWFYSHPAVYIMIIPGFGVINEIIPCFSRRKIFGYKFMAIAMMASRSWASSSGATTCSSAASRCTPGLSSRSSAS